MNYVVISDVHVIDPKDSNAKILMTFLEHEKTTQADGIILLGDIFDVLVGGYKEYVERYSEIFSKIKLLADSGKEVILIEGNHDFLNSRLQKHLSSINFKVYRKGITKKIGTKVYRFEHGDDVEIDNFSYKVYKKIINNQIMNVLTKTIIPYCFVCWLGGKMSRASRDYSSGRFTNEVQEIVKLKFRESAGVFRKKYKFDYLIMGHSHIKDFYMENEFTYLNNGFPGESKTFISIEGDTPPLFVNLV